MTSLPVFLSKPNWIFALASIIGLSIRSIFSNVLRRLLAMPLVEARVIFLSTNVSNFEFLLVAFHTLAYVFHSIGHVAQ